MVPCAAESTPDIGSVGPGGGVWERGGYLGLSQRCLHKNALRTMQTNSEDGTYSERFFRVKMSASSRAPAARAESLILVVFSIQTACR